MLGVISWRSFPGLRSKMSFNFAINRALIDLWGLEARNVKSGDEVPSSVLEGTNASEVLNGEASTYDGREPS